MCQCVQLSRLPGFCFVFFLCVCVCVCVCGGGGGGGGGGGCVLNAIDKEIMVV